MLLSRESILTANDLQTTDVDVPEWGGTVRVRSLTGTVRDLFGRSLIGEDGKANGKLYNIKLVAVSAVDEQGVPLFTLEDVEILGTKSAPALERVAAAAEAFNKMGPGAVEAEAGN